MNRIIVLLLYLITFSLLLFGQEIDRSNQQSLINSIKQRITSRSDSKVIKCGTPIIATAQRQLTTFPEVLSKAANILWYPRSAKQKSRLSPSGKFRIHYDTTGSSTPALINDSLKIIPGTYENYIDSVSAIFDYVWLHHIITLQYDAPPSDGLRGGGPEYDIYVDSRLNSDLMYGITDWEGENPLPGGPPVKYATYIYIDNTYSNPNYYSKGIDGLRVTAAHEFHHAIQIGAYGLWDDVYFNEITSTWMEDLTYPNVNDYIFYLRDYFRKFRDDNNRPYAFTENNYYSGYERSVWAHFLAKRFSADVLKDIWMNIRTQPALQSMATVLQKKGSSLDYEFALFSKWNFFTADRADTNQYYSEGQLYPRFLPNFYTNYGGVNSKIQNEGRPFSSQFLEFRFYPDSLVVVLTNTNWRAIDTLTSSFRTYQCSLSADAPSSPMRYQQLGRSLFLGFYLQNSDEWQSFPLSTTGIIDFPLMGGGPSPNPFRLDKDKVLTIPFWHSTELFADVLIFSISMELKFKKTVRLSGGLYEKSVSIQPSELRDILATGVYFIYVQSGGREQVWKVAVIK